MKKLVLMSIVSSLTVGCTSTRIDDHSYHYINSQTKTVNHNEAPQQPAPVPQNKDQEYVQFKQQDVAPVSYDDRRSQVEIPPPITYQVPYTPPVYYRPTYRPVSYQPSYFQYAPREIFINGYSGHSRRRH